MIYASVCDGIGAAHAAWKPLGWRCAWTSEIEPFPIAVVDHHYGLPNLGDMTKITEADVEKHGRIDLLVGGTPCQSFSVAGLRGGMADPRGNLALRFLQLAGTLRPAWLVWENVPGVLSSNEGRDFGAFLGALGQLGYGWAYRVLDARYFGVPQRRRRPFVVGYLGDWRRAASVLLERESMCGHPPPCGEAAKDIANTVGAGAGERGYEPNENYIHSEALCLNAGGTGRLDGESETFIPVTVGTLMHGKRLAGSVTLQDVCSGHAIPVAHALRADGHDASEDGTGGGTPLVFDWQSGGDVRHNVSSEATSAIQRCQVPAVAFQEAQTGCREYADAGTLRSGGPGHDPVGTRLRTPSGVRRLTPRECERLQGFPTCITRVIIQVWFGSEKTESAHAEVTCRSVLSNALLADDGESRVLASYVDATLWNDQESRESHVAAHVRTSHGHGLQAVRSAGKWLWLVSGAGRRDEFLPSTQRDDFARATALLVPDLAHLVGHGRVESPANTRSFTLQSLGSSPAETFGQGRGADASDAASRRIEGMRFITSKLGRDTPHSDLPLETLLSCVVTAMTSFIPGRTQGESFYRFVLDHETDYTAIKYRGKPAADAPRYKALGNSMAVPCMAWIGNRIATPALPSPPQCKEKQ